MIKAKTGGYFMFAYKKEPSKVMQCKRIIKRRDNDAVVMDKDAWNTRIAKAGTCLTSAVAAWREAGRSTGKWRSTFAVGDNGETKSYGQNSTGDKHAELQVLDSYAAGDISIGVSQYMCTGGYAVAVPCETTVTNGYEHIKPIFVGENGTSGNPDRTGIFLPGKEARKSVSDFKEEEEVEAKPMRQTTLFEYQEFFKTGL